MPADGEVDQLLGGPPSRGKEPPVLMAFLITRFRLSMAFLVLDHTGGSRD